jgi:alpha-tubulin suppressor-like RCC1 family protein
MCTYLDDYCANAKCSLTDDGYVYSWGSGAVGRLGHGEQKDELYPRVIDNFTSPNPIMRATKIACGNTNSLAVDGQGMLHLWGKFKNTGDGSTGSVSLSRRLETDRWVRQPWMMPRAVQDTQQLKINHITGGGVTLFAVVRKGPDSDAMVIGMGQNAANGELGLGVRIGFCSTKATDSSL